MLWKEQMTRWGLIRRRKKILAIQTHRWRNLDSWETSWQRGTISTWRHMPHPGPNLSTGRRRYCSWTQTPAWTCPWIRRGVGSCECWPRSRWHRIPPWTCSSCPWSRGWPWSVMIGWVGSSRRRFAYPSRGEQVSRSPAEEGQSSGFGRCLVWRKKGF